MGGDEETSYYQSALLWPRITYLHECNAEQIEVERLDASPLVFLSLQESCNLLHVISVQLCDQTHQAEDYCERQPHC